MPALSKGTSKSAGELGSILGGAAAKNAKAEEKAVKAAQKANEKGDPLAPVVSNGKISEPGNLLSNNLKLSDEEVLAKYQKKPSAEYKAYQNEVADRRAGTFKEQSEAPKAQGGATGTTEAPKPQGGVTGTTEAPKAQGGAKSAISSGLKTVGAAGLMGAGLVGIPAIIEGVASLSVNPDQEGSGGNPFLEWIDTVFGAGDDGKPTSGGDPGDRPAAQTTQPEKDGQLDEWLKRFLDGGYIYNPDEGYIYDPATGEVAYIGGGGDPGESGAGSVSSIFGDAAELLKNNLPLIIGIVVIIAIIVFASKGSSKKPKRKTGGSHA